MLHSARRKYIVIFRKLIYATAFTFFLALLGIFSGLGYRVHHIEELSFIPHSRLGYADVVFNCDMIYDPVLYPLYWMVGSGHISGNFSIMYLPEGYYPGEYGGPVWGYHARERYDAYISDMLSWGMLLNLFILFNIAIVIEIVEKRSLYLVLFCGILGFFVAEILGVIIGMIVSALALFMMLKFWSDNFIVRFWYSLWE